MKFFHKGESHGPKGNPKLKQKIMKHEEMELLIKLEQVVVLHLCSS